MFIHLDKESLTAVTNLSAFRLQICSVNMSHSPLCVFFPVTPKTSNHWSHPRSLC